VLKATDGAVRLPGSSHAETALASRVDVGVALNSNVVQVIKWEFSSRCYIFDLANLLGGYRTEERCCKANEGEEEKGTIHLV